MNIDRSTGVSALAGAIVTVLVFIAGELGVEIPPVVASAIAVIVMAILTHKVSDETPTAPPTRP